MIPWFEWKTISIGPLTLQVWGLFVALGMTLAIWIIYKRSKKLGLNPDSMFNLGFWMILFGILFARIFHIVFYEPTFYFSYPSEILKIWHGGMSSFGGMFGAALCFGGFIKKHDLRAKIFTIADLVSFSAVFGWIVGRIGCFMIHDHLGAHSSCPFALQTPDGPRLEMAFLEIVGMIPLALLFYFSRNKKRGEGWYGAVLFLYYGVLRFVLDFFRARDIVGADTRFFGLTPGQYFAIILTLLGAYQLQKIYRKK